jgi:hypothetical protein
MNRNLIPNWPVQQESFNSIQPINDSIDRADIQHDKAQNIPSLFRKVQDDGVNTHVHSPSMVAEKRFNQMHLILRLWR